MVNAEDFDLFYIRKTRSLSKIFDTRWGKQWFRKVSSHNAVLTGEVSMAVRDSKVMPAFQGEMAVGGRL